MFSLGRGYRSVVLYLWLVLRGLSDSGLEGSSEGSVFNSASTSPSNTDGIMTAFTPVPVCNFLADGVDVS